MSNTAAGVFIQEVSVFTGQALVTMASKAGLTVGSTLAAALLIRMVVARGAAGDTDPVSGEKKRDHLVTNDSGLNLHVSLQPACQCHLCGTPFCLPRVPPMQGARQPWLYNAISAKEAISC